MSDARRLQDDDLEWRVRQYAEAHPEMFDVRNLPHLTPTGEPEEVGMVKDP